MGKSLGIALFGLIVFAASAAGSWLMRSQLNDSQPETAEAAPADRDASLSSGSAEHGSDSDSSDRSGDDDGILPVAVRPRAMSVEELLRYGMGLKEREKQIREQEDELQKRRVRQQIVLADVQGERKEVDGMRVQMRDHLKTAEKLIETLNQSREQLLQEKESAAEELKKVKEARIEIDGEHLDNTKRLSQWIQGMEPEKAGELLREMANDGNMTMAVQILANFEEREAAKILSSLDDPKIVQQFVEEFRNLKKPEKKPIRR
jgi:uncharacterized membrane-anchored protein YhcB (DUF1043 family)